MTPKFHAALTDRQRDIVKMALAAMEINPDYGFTESEIIETLKLFAKREEPAPRVEHIPVLLNMANQDPVGFGVIAGSELFIQINNELLVDRVDRLFSTGDIRELYFGVGFSFDPVSLERTNAEIGEALGLSESVVRTILEDK